MQSVSISNCKNPDRIDLAFSSLNGELPEETCGISVVVYFLVRSKVISGSVQVFLIMFLRVEAWSFGS